MEKETCCHYKTKEHSEQEYKSLISWLDRIEGQMRGVRSMVEKDTYCTDILVQAMVVNAALNSFSKELLTSHIWNCVVDDIRDNKEETIGGLVATIRKLMR